VTKTRLLLLAAVPLVIVVTVGVLVMLPRSKVTKANFARIQDGMTEAEIEEIFGEPRSSTIRTGAKLWGVWRADDGISGDEVCIDLSNGYVSQKHWHIETESILVNLRRRFPLPFVERPPRRNAFRVLPKAEW
jgi:hypothetical protein